jgi:hypothetical protein
MMQVLTDAIDPRVGPSFDQFVRSSLGRDGVCARWLMSSPRASSRCALEDWKYRNEYRGPRPQEANHA